MKAKTSAVLHTAENGVDHAEERSALASHAASFSIDLRLAAAGILQALLVDVIDLGLQAKQAHWNIHGRMFREIHALLDDLAEDAGNDADALAERCLALGVAADGRVSTLVRDSHLVSFTGGRIDDHRVVDLIVARLPAVSEVGRSRVGQLGEFYLVSQYLVNGVLAGIEKKLWFFEAHRPAETG